MVDREQDAQAAEKVRATLAGSTFWGLTPTQVELHRSPDASGEEAWVFAVNLPDPDPVSGAWPVEALNAFAREARSQAISHELSWPWYVVFFPESEEEQVDEDQLQLPEG